MSIAKINFKNFLINEGKEYLSGRIGTILSIIQELLQNSQGMGKRQIVLNCENIVSKIRAILQDKWDEKEKKYLKKLQKCGVAIAKCIEDKGELLDALEASSNEIEKMLSELGGTVNTLGNSDEKSNSEEQPENDQDENLESEEE